MNLGLFVLRLAVGGFFVGHGAQKLFGSFGGHGLAGTAQFFDSLGMKPGRRNALAAGLAEFVGGMLIVLGLFTPFAAAAITAVMVVAVLTVHGKNGPWSTNGGYEYNAVLAASVFALSGAGAGAWSIDHAAGLHLAGPWWAVLELAVGLLGGYGAVMTARREAELERRRTATSAATVPPATPNERFARTAPPSARPVTADDRTLEREPIDRLP